ncbi:MAG: acyl-CoA thioesterase [Bacilli bacterium]
MRLKQMQLDQFPFVTFDKIRYRDTDRQGHVNNAVFGTYFETGRVELLYNANNGFLSTDCSFVVAKVTLELIQEIHWPGKVDIGTGILRIGNSSLVVGANLYQDGKLVATSETIVVQVNNKTHRSQVLLEASKEHLHAYLLVQDEN